MANIFEEAVRNIMDDAVSWRRHLHQNPELPFEEVETTKYIIEVLEKLDNIELKQVSPTGVLGFLKGKKPGKVVGLRADIDALAVNEETDVPYKSVNDNVMHACGHDAHTAILLATAQILNDKVDELSGEVIFIFQAAEELFPGGAKAIVESGALDHMDYVFAQHVIPMLNTGEIGFMKGASFAASDSFDITIQGKGGHAAMPNMAIDPVVIAAEMISAFQTIVSRKTNPKNSPIISTTVINTPGNATNVIPDTVNLKGSVRNYDEGVRQESEDWIKEISEGIAKVHGASAECSYVRGYDIVVNDEECFEISKKAALSFVDEKHVVTLPEAISGSEDFSAYLKIAPGNYTIVGVGNPEKETTIANHNPKFKIDDDALYYGIMQFLNTVAEILM